MGQFKPMVKMFTDEPSVILKLKKGGKVKAAGQSEGFKSMSQTSGGNPFADSESGKSPKKPSMAERQKAMNPNLYKKGGKVAHKQLGGAMPVAAAPAVAPLGRAAVAAMNPAARATRAALVRRALTGMKKGGSTSDCAKLEKELKHHEALSAKKAHGKASGGEIDAAETKTTLKGNVGKFAKTKMDTSKKDKAHGTGEVKEGKPAGYAMGGTIEGNEGPFKNTKVVTSSVDRAHGTGGVRMGNAGGFKKGGKAVRKASGGAIDAKLTRTTVEGGDWENRPANTSKPGKSNTKTGEVKEANAGGFKKGGHAKKAYATGGNVVDDGKAQKMPRHFKSQPVANTLQSGTFKKGGKVKKFADGGTSGDFSPLEGEGSPISDINPPKRVDPNDPLLIPRTNISPSIEPPQTNGMFNTGNVPDTRRGWRGFLNPEGVGSPTTDFVGSPMTDQMPTAAYEPGFGYSANQNVGMRRPRYGNPMGGYGAIPAYADGGDVDDREYRAMQQWRNQERLDNEADRRAMENLPSKLMEIPGRVYRAAKDYFSPPPAPGSVTKTEKSVTVSPKKRGGKC